jgi:hypothetical protein
MRDLLIGIIAVITVAGIGSVWAQTSQPAAPQYPAAADPAQRYPFPGLTPEDAYRAGLLNRWQLEQYQGPTAQALQGPSVNGGSKGGSGAGGGM